MKKKIRILQNPNELKAAKETVNDISLIYGNVLSIKDDVELLIDTPAIITPHICEMIFLVGKFFENNYRIASLSNPQNQ